MIFREIKVGELIAFVSSTFYKNANIIPITPQRAISQANNPYAQPEDIALILALDDDEKIMGYIGVIPGKTTFSEERFFWNSCWWVDKEKGKTAAMPLFYAFLKHSNFNTIFFDLTPHTSQIVTKLGFTTIINEGVKVFLRFNSAQILPKKHSYFSYVKPILFFADFIVNLLQNFRLAVYKNRNKVAFVVLEVLDDETSLFLEKMKKNDIVPFNQQMLNWIITYPWVVTNPTKAQTEIAKKYFFSYVVGSFAIKTIKIIENNTIIGLVVATIREGDMKLSYCFFEENYIKQVTATIFDFAIKNNIRSITTFNSLIASEIAKKPTIFNKIIIKHAAFPTKMSELQITEKVLQDGDAVFT